ncbi:alpha/beta fold hydrolase [Octadecabacter sp. 1_MG-2023]|uniref:alpha/beta hydrolase n=1 Tax=unclassified Octadecabacter TaxID=196158 RepID=UPI001C081E64|nr:MULTISPECIES: alpha/beta fold hydrolase [unclassified Octadecabacter]MBU2992829.1 alpha/beta fold hydrolase [Octadecabacter sp. B2R22]MDO6733720.1 alpha/beta fold hydrolase [Octadecabacter sp. 1_MG-2023]
MSYELPELAGLDAYLSQNEAAVGGIRPGCEKQIIWADGPKKTKVGVVYVHGFSASLGEVRPLPDLIAKAFGANLFYTRLTGHGQDGAAMGRATLDEWHADVAEALDIGAAIGDEVIVIGCSTGCTLLTSAFARGADVKAVVHVSPNFGLRHVFAGLLLRMPGIRTWGRFVVGKNISFEPRSDAHEKYWTINYDTQAVFTMEDAVSDALSQPIESITRPAYFALCDADRVVHPAKIRAVMARWAGPTKEDVLVQGPDDDTDGHVMAGDVMSPRQTAPLADRIITWLRDL